MENKFLTLNNYELENINGGAAPLVPLLIKAGCAIGATIFTAGAVSGAAKAYKEK